MELINKILSAKSIYDVIPKAFSDDEATKAYHAIIKEIHPDVCKHAKAGEAMIKLNTLRNMSTHGMQYTDDVCTIQYTEDHITLTGKEEFIAKTYKWYNILKQSKTYDVYKNYIPKDIVDLSATKLVYKIDRRCVPLNTLCATDITANNCIGQDHVNWILSRLLEFCVWCSINGVVHLGLNPDSVFITPKDHGIYVCTFYHMQKLGCAAKTISTKYKAWYPYQLLSNKIADTSIDIELAKKTALAILGDTSGAGVGLRGKINNNALNYLLTYHTDIKKAYISYRDMLSANFEKRFVPLDI